MWVSHDSHYYLSVLLVLKRSSLLLEAVLLLVLDSLNLGTTDRGSASLTHRISDGICT
jgi:hypothetical protein